MNALDMLLGQVKLPQPYSSFFKTYQSLQSSLRMFQMLNELNNQNRETIPISFDVPAPPIPVSESTADLAGSLHVNPTHRSSILKKRINKIKGEIPPTLAQSFGYQGNERWIQIFLATEPISKPICSDGRTIYCGTLLAWELLIDSISHNFDRLDDSIHQIAFLFDRWENNLYYGTKETITELLTNPECLGLLQSTTPAPVGRNDLTQIRDFSAIFILGGIVGATVAGVLFSIGLGLFQATH